jgi:hypothetical protein
MNNVNSLANVTRTVIETSVLVENSPSSIFTKDDVLRLLSEISTESKNVSLNRESVDRLLEMIDSTINDVDASDIIDKSTAEFSLDGNQIELDNVDIDGSYIFNEVEEVVNEWYKDIRNY